MLNTVNISQPNFFLTLFTGLKDFFGLFSVNFRLFSLTKEHVSATSKVLLQTVTEKT